MEEKVKVRGEADWRGVGVARVNAGRREARTMRGALVSCIMMTIMRCR